MNRNELFSFIEAFLAIISLWIALLLAKGVWCLLAFCSFLALSVASMGVFKGKGKEANRVETAMRVVVFFCGMLLVGYALHQQSIHDPVGKWMFIVYLIGIIPFVLYSIYFQFTPKGWFLRRLQWVEGKPLDIQKINNVLCAGSDDITTLYYHLLSNRIFLVVRKLFINPLRQEKECGERGYQAQAKMKWGRLPVDVFVDNESPFYFKVVVRMWKPDATKATLHRVIDALSELSDEDTHLYFSIRVDEEVWYIHSFRYEVVQAKAYMVSDEGALVPHEETDTQALKHQPQQLLYLVLNVKSLDELEGFSILTPEEFERRTA